MFVVCQLPFADARPYLRDTGRLLAPDWPNADAESEFIRFVGRVQKRRDLGDNCWPGEGVFCDARRLVRFASPPYRWDVGTGPGRGSLACEFRRLFADGLGVVRLEIGLSLGQRSKPQPALSLDAQGCTNLLNACLAMPVTVPQPGSTAEPLELLRARGRIAARLLDCTTAAAGRGGPEAFTPQAWWLDALRPMLLIEYRDDEIAALPPQARSAPAPPAHGLALAHLRQPGQFVETTVWFLHVADGADPDALRRLRIYLFRLHAERECLRQLLRLAASHRIPVPYALGEDEYELFSRYLDRAQQIFFAGARYGIQQSPILDLAYHYDDLISEDERAGLEQRLEMVRGNVRRNTLRMVDAQNAAVQAARTYVDARGAANVQVGDKGVQVGSVGGSLTGAVGTDIHIQDSFKTATPSAAGDEQETRLTDEVQPA